jgi:hypothetical protein
MRTLSQNSRSLGQYLDPKNPEYEAELLTTPPRSLVRRFLMGYILFGEDDDLMIVSKNTCTCTKLTLG